MALITCPECGKQISDKAPVCTNCGSPSAAEVHRIKKDFQKKRKSSDWLIVTGILMSVLGFTALLVIPFWKILFMLATIIGIPLFIVGFVISPSKPIEPAFAGQPKKIESNANVRPVLVTLAVVSCIIGSSIFFFSHGNLKGVGLFFIICAPVFGIIGLLIKEPQNE